MKNQKKGTRSDSVLNHSIRKIRLNLNVIVVDTYLHLGKCKENASYSDEIESADVAVSLDFVGYFVSIDI